MKGKKLLGVVGAGALGFGGVAGFWFYTQNQFEHEDTSRLLIPERDYTDKEAEQRFKSRYTFVLDMDETLLHTSFKTDTEGKVAVRQFAGDLLTSTAELGEMVLWTAGTEGYARLALKLLGPQTELFHERIFRNRLWWGEMMQNTKRLVMLNRDPDYTLIVDNHAYVVDVEDANNAVRALFPIILWIRSSNAHRRTLARTR